MLRIGLYGTNGHQVQHGLAVHPELARLAAVAAIPDDLMPPPASSQPAIRRHESLEALLADPEIDLVSLCSPRRADQAAHAVRALRAGKHVLAEKPCALTETDLDLLITTARETGRTFHEMASTAFEQPYFAMREVVRSGALGEIVQVVAEKSYPYHGDRPQDEALDGGLIAQNAIHALRFVEHVACTPIVSVRAVETTLGNPVVGGGLRLAACLLLTLKNGGVASLSANYLNPRGTRLWGYESLKILGTDGFAESQAGGERTRLVIGDEDHGPLDTTVTGISWLQMVLTSILGDGEMPLTLHEELSPTRWAIRANDFAKAGP